MNRLGLHLHNLKIRNHPVLGDMDLSFINPKTNKPYDVIAFVGENGCGKTTLLNELFNYDKSKYITEKEDIGRPRCALFLRQGSVHSNALKEVRKLIDGKDMYPTSSFKDPNYGCRTWNNHRIENIVEELGDKHIGELVKNDKLDDITCSGEVSKLIDGKEHGYNITSFSSGEQEILLKLKDIQELSYDDFLLLDEPETSLHPRWQRKILDLIQQIIDTELGEKSQIFLATHSEKVLESLIENENALIVRLFKKDGVIVSEPVSQMDLVLPKVTFAELDYVIFGIESFEYCNELFDCLEWKLDVKGDSGIDKAILNSEFYDKDRHYKEWYNDVKKKVTSNTLPVYVRNYFHHPKDRIPPTKEELIESISLLKKVLSSLKK